MSIGLCQMGYVDWAMTIGICQLVYGTFRLQLLGFDHLAKYIGLWYLDSHKVVYVVDVGGEPALMSVSTSITSSFTVW